MRLKAPAHSCPLDLRLWFRPLSLWITVSHLKHERNEHADVGSPRWPQFQLLVVSRWPLGHQFFLWVMIVDVVSLMELCVVYLNNPVHFFSFQFFWFHKMNTLDSLWKIKSPFFITSLFLMIVITHNNFRFETWSISNSMAVHLYVSCISWRHKLSPKSALHDPFYVPAYWHTVGKILAISW